MNGGGGSGGHPSDGPDVSERAVLLNACSMCEAATHQAMLALIELRNSRARGSQRYDASETLQQLCSEHSQVWKKEYGLSSASSSVGLVTGPGVSQFEFSRSGDLVHDPQIGEGVAFKLFQYCAETLLGADLDEDELYDLVAAKAAKGAHIQFDVKARSALQHVLCDKPEQPCGRYASLYPTHRRLGGLRNSNKDDL